MKKRKKPRKSEPFVVTVKYDDPVDHPAHYTAHPSGVECIDIVEHFPHNIATAIAYLWRCDLKGAPIQDLEKARWYVDREIQRRKTAK